jgi:hypothetical protein
VRGYATRAEHWEKQRRRQLLAARLAHVEARIQQRRVSIVRGGRRLVKTRQHLQDAGLTERQWRQRWEAARWFVSADGEADKAWGNETIRVHPEAGWLELKLPAPLVELANRPHGRYRLSCLIRFAHRGDEWAAQAASGAVRYDIIFHPNKRRWYLDASWRRLSVQSMTVRAAVAGGVVAVDLNAAHMDCFVVDRHGTPPVRPPPSRLSWMGCRPLPGTGASAQRSSRFLTWPVAQATGRSPWRPWTSLMRGQSARKPWGEVGAGGGSDARWPAFRPGGSGIGWCRWRPAGGLRWWPWIPAGRRCGVAATGSSHSSGTIRTRG